MTDRRLYEMLVAIARRLQRVKASKPRVRLRLHTYATVATAAADRLATIPDIMARMNCKQEMCPYVPGCVRHLAEDNDRLRRDRDRYYKRLQFDPQGSDKIDELEQALEHLRAELHEYRSAAALLLRSQRTVTNGLKDT